MHYQDVTYLEGVADQWATAEATCGILAICLPLSPKFFESVRDKKLWSRFKTSLLSLTGSTTAATRSSETSPEESKAAKLSNKIGSSKLQANFAKYNHVSTYSVDLASMSDRSLVPVPIPVSERAAQNHYEMSIP